MLRHRGEHLLRKRGVVGHARTAHQGGVRGEPRMSGSSARASMPSRLAPSAKILIRSGRGSAITGLLLNKGPKDPRHSFTEVGDDSVGILGRALGVPPVDQDSPAACSTPRFDVPPTIANHEASGEIELEIGRRRQQHPGSGFPTVAAVSLVMKADHDRVGLKRFADDVVHGLYYLSTLVSSCNVRLVRHHDHRKPGPASSGPPLRPRPTIRSLPTLAGGSGFPPRELLPG